MHTTNKQTAHKDAELTITSCVTFSSTQGKIKIQDLKKASNHKNNQPIPPVDFVDLQRYGERTHVRPPMATAAVFPGPMEITSLVVCLRLRCSRLS